MIISRNSAVFAHKLLHNKKSIPVVFSDFIAPARITQASNPPGDVSAKTTIAFRQRGDGLTLPDTTVSHWVPSAFRQVCGFIQTVAIRLASKVEISSFY